MSYFDRLSVAKKLNYSLLLVLCSFLLLMGLFLYSYHIINLNAETKDSLTRLSEQVWKTRQGYNAVRADLFQALFIRRANDSVRTEKIKELYRKRIESINEAVTSIEASKYILSKESRLSLDKFVSDIVAFTALTSDRFEKLMHTVGEEEFAAQERYFSSEYNQEYSKLRNQSTEVQAAIGKEYDLCYANSKKTQQIILVLTFFTVAIMMLALTFVFVFIRRSLISSIRQTKEQIETLSMGEIPEMNLKKGEERTEFYLIKKSIFDYVEQMKRVLYFTTSVGESRFDTAIDFFGGRGPIAKSLIRMREGLIEAHERSQVQNWHNTGIARLSAILQEHKKETDKLYSVLLSFIVKYLNSNQGTLFIAEDSQDGIILEEKACYVYDRRKFLSRTIVPGEGLAGTAFLEKQPIFITDVPPDYIQITSGLGEATPRCVVIFPLLQNEKAEGVLELASFNVFTPAMLEFMEAATRMLASELMYLRMIGKQSRQVDAERFRADNQD